VKDEAERQVKHGADRDRDQVAPAAIGRDRRWRPASVRRLSVIRSNTAQASTRAEQHDSRPRSPFEIRCATAQVFTADQHRMLERAPEIAADIGRHHEGCWPAHIRSCVT